MPKVVKAKPTRKQPEFSEAELSQLKYLRMSIASPPKDEAGNFIVQSSEDANLLLNYAGLLQDQIDATLALYNLTEKDNEVKKVRKQLAEYMKNNNVDNIVYGDYDAIVVTRCISQWVLTSADIPENIELEDPTAKITPLLSIFKKKWKDDKDVRKALAAVTRRVPDEHKIDEFVRGGNVTPSEIANSLMSYVQTRYALIRHKPTPTVADEIAAEDS